MPNMILLILDIREMIATITISSKLFSLHRNIHGLLQVSICVFAYEVCV